MVWLGRRIDPKDSLANRSLGSEKEDGARNESAGETIANPDAQKVGGPIEQFQPREPFFRLDKVILPETTLQQLIILKNRIVHHKVLYEDWGLKKIDPFGKRVAVNLYGPPGTGKTMLAEALASDLGKKIIDVSYAEIESKYVGETGKNIVAAFRKAAESDAMLFFDEADSILGRRMTNVTQAADQAVNVSRAVMLKQLDAFDGIVVFATNLARNFDGAFVRRILQHIEIPLPDQGCRDRLWRLFIDPVVPGYGDLDWNALAEKSDGLSGGDMKNAVIAAFSEAVGRPEPERKVGMADLLTAIESVRKAKHDIGQRDPGAGARYGGRRIIKDEIISKEEAKKDAETTEDDERQ